MSIIKVYYSDVTKEVYMDKKNAEVAESTAKHDELVSEFDELRQQYNQEHAELRAKYQDKFDAILTAISDLEHKQLQE